MFFNNKFNTFFGLNLTLVYTFPMCMTWCFHFPLRNYDFKCACARVCVRARVHVELSLCTGTYVCVFAREDACVNVLLRGCARGNVCLFVRKWLCVHACRCACACANVCVRVSGRGRVRVHVHLC